MPTQPRYLVTVTLEDGTALFHGGSDMMLLRRNGESPALCVVVAEELVKWLGPEQLSATITPPTPVADEPDDEHLEPVPDRLRRQVRDTHRSLISLLEMEALRPYIAPDAREALTKGAQELYTLRAALAIAAGQSPREA